MLRNGFAKAEKPPVDNFHLLPIANTLKIESPNNTSPNTFKMAAPPAFTDISKSSNDLLTKDFYHLSAAALEIKNNTPNNVTFKVTGKSTHESKNSGALEAKYTDKPNGIYFTKFTLTSRISKALAFMVNKGLRETQLLMIYRRTGFTVTQSWNTANALDNKMELNDVGAKGLKLEALGSFLPVTLDYGAKVNIHFKQPKFHVRALFDLAKGPTANIDAVIGQDGFLAGASAAYDVQRAAITNYSASVGYTRPEYTAAITGANNMTVFSASYYHKVDANVEAGAKASWNSKNSNTVGLEVASKYRLDPLSFAKVKMNDRGVVAIAYNVLLRPGVTLGLGASFDTQKMDQATHKIGTSFTFDS